ncbi:MAG TPA: ATPase, T2SS/T4P/T4SS family, partial [Candidatus Saccharimonadia bacterium]|nr:ATPase, T2SS/T4P/T4SS family [Candidatus Saccharimonadia bacterium]
MNDVAIADIPVIESLSALDERISLQLIARGRLKETDLVRARRLFAEAPDGSFVTLMTRLGLVSERDAAEAVAEVLKLPLLASKECPDGPPPNVLVSVRFLKQHHVVPITESEEDVGVLVADPQERYPIEAIELAVGKPVKIHVGIRSEIDDLIERYYGSGRSAMGTIVENLGDESSRSEDDVEHLRDLASEAPVIRLVNLVIQRAVEARASDIHIEPFENRLKVRYRIDGVLEEVESPPAASTAAVISRIKIMAKLNIAERRLPQDGRIMLRVQGKELDLRVSSVPTQYGESVVMRILDRETVVFDFKKLGFTDEFLPRFDKVLEQPHG